MGLCNAVGGIFCTLEIPDSSILLYLLDLLFLAPHLFIAMQGNSL